MLVLLSFLSLLFCLTAGSFLTSDCISSEKREGTLGLLFLTPLNGLDIVLGKLICHGLQTFYGICAIFPIFFLPLLIGGVTWAEVSRIVLALALGLFLSAAVGALVSTLGTESRQTILTTFTAITLIASVPMLYLMARTVFWRSLPKLPAQLSPVFTVLSGFDAYYRTASGPAMFWGSAAAVGALGLASLVAAGLLLRRVFQDLVTSSDPVQTPLTLPAQGLRLQRNPCEWVVLRNAGGGSSLGLLSTLGLLFFAAMLLVSLNTSHWGEGFSAAFFTALAIHVVAKLRLAVEATRQINTDHRNGAIELLLVTSLPEESILNGYRNALRRLSRRPLFLLIGLNLVLESSVLLFPSALHMDLDDRIMFSTLFLGGAALAAADFSALRWRAFLTGLKASSHTRAVLLTFSSVMVWPWLAFGIIVGWLSGPGSGQKTIIMVFLAWALTSLAYDLFLIRRCRAQLKGGVRRLASESA